MSNLKKLPKRHRSPERKNSAASVSDIFIDWYREG